MIHSCLSDFYEEKVLPALFERLDWAFPEFQWTRTACGWTGSRRGENGYTDPSGSATILCSHPWGFVDQNGNAISWISYVGRSHGANGSSFTSIVKTLANLAGVDDGVLNSVSHLDEQEAERNERGRELAESFVAYCQARLWGVAGANVTSVLEREYGISTHSIRYLPIGLYTSPGDVVQHLLARGFSHDEIAQSYLVCDERISGRLIVPWRDRWGRIATIAAQDLAQPNGRAGQLLYLKGGEKTEAFGLDVALRPGSGGHEHLILVDTILDAIFFQSVGLSNVATIGTRDNTVSSDHWTKLAEHEIRAVTLATIDRDPLTARSWSSLDQLNHSRNAPQVFTLAMEDFGRKLTAADLVRGHGLDRFRDVLKKRIHVYRCVALEVVRKHKQAAEWTDDGLSAAIHEAVEFDSRINDPQRNLDLERYFWPTILESTGVCWDRLRYLHRGSFREEPTQRQMTLNAGHLKTLLCELETALRASDYEGFKKLICTAARDFETDGQHPDFNIVDADLNWRYPLKDETDESIDGFAKDGLYDDPHTKHGEYSSMSPLDDLRRPASAEIRAMAYELWDRDGRPVGLDQYFWFRAEQALLEQAVTETADWQE